MYEHRDAACASVLIGSICTIGSFFFSTAAYGQNKFFSTPNRGGAEGAKGNAMLHTLINENAARMAETAANAASITALRGAVEKCGEAQMVYGPDSPDADADGCVKVTDSCGDVGMIGGDGHALANADGCIPSLQVANDGRVSFQGGVKIGNYSLCDATTEGTLRYVSAHKAVLLCDGTSWVEVGASPAAGGTFTPVTSAELSTQYTSNAVGVSGFFGTRTATATNGATILVNGFAQGSSANVQAGDSIALRMGSAGTFSTAKTTNLSLSSLTTNWTITTRGQDTSPNTFSFANANDQELNSIVVSSAVTVSGFDGPLTASVSGQGSPQVKVGAGSWGTSADVNPGQTLQLRLTSSATNSSTRIATLTLGTATVNWEVTTKSAAICHSIGQSAGGGVCAETGPNALIVEYGNAWELTVATNQDWQPSKSGCENATINGLSDWYLPTHNELNLICQLSGQGSASFGSMSNNHWWSSTEHATWPTNAYYIYFGPPCYSTHVNKVGNNVQKAARCVRRQ